VLYCRYLTEVSYKKGIRMLLNIVRGFCGTAFLLSCYGLYLLIADLATKYIIDTWAYYITIFVYVMSALFSLGFLAYNFRKDASKWMG
jgi:hypothetical protein